MRKKGENVCVMGERGKCLCDGREIKNVCVMGERGYLSRTPRPRNAFSPPPPPFAGKPETRFYLKHTNPLIINGLFKLLIINVLL